MKKIKKWWHKTARKRQIVNRNILAYLFCCMLMYGIVFCFSGGVFIPKDFADFILVAILGLCVYIAGLFEYKEIFDE